MRVLQLGPFPPPQGGVQNNLVAIRRYLLNRQVPCEVINLTRHRKVDADGVYYPSNWLQVLWLLLRLRYDVIHLHIGGKLTLRLIGLSFICSIMPHSKAVITFHSGGYPSSKEGRSAHPRTLRGYVFRKLDRIIAVNPEIVELFHKFGVQPERIRLIYPHALPTQLPDQPMPESLNNFFKSHKPVLLTVGLLEREYDLPLQIEVLGSILQRSKNAGLIIIGSGSNESDLRNLINSKPYAENILLCGDVPHPVALNAIKKSGLFLRTTLYDGDSIAVREALHLGCPVIATDNGMRPEGVILIPKSNLNALKRAIEDNLNEPPSYHKHKDQSGEKNIEAVMTLYKELIEETGM